MFMKTDEIIIVQSLKCIKNVLIGIRYGKVTLILLYYKNIAI